MSTPCNTLNVEYIKISNLDEYTSFADNDLIYIIQSGSGDLKYSKRSKLVDFKSYMTSASFSGTFTGDVVGTSSHSVSSSYSLSSSYSSTSAYAEDSLSSSYSSTSAYAEDSLSSSYSLTSSYADTVESSSYSLTSSYADTVESSSYSLTSSFATRASFSNSIAPGFPYITSDTLSNLLTPDTTNNVTYRHDHGLGYVPSLIQVKLYVSETWTGGLSYQLGDELDTSVFTIGNDVFETNPIWVTCNNTSIFITYSGYVADAKIAAATRMFSFSAPANNNETTSFPYPGWVGGIAIEWDKLKYKIYVWK